MTDDIIAVKQVESAAFNGASQTFTPWYIDNADHITANGEKMTGMVKLDIAEIISAKYSNSYPSLGGRWIILNNESSSGSYIIGQAQFRIGKSSDTTLRINLKVSWWTTPGSGTPVITNDDYFNDVPIPVGVHALYIFCMVGKDSAPDFWCDLTWSFTPSISNSTNQTTSQDTSTLSQTWTGDGVQRMQYSVFANCYSNNSMSMITYRPVHVDDPVNNEKKYQFPLDRTDADYQDYVVMSDSPFDDNIYAMEIEDLINITTSLDVIGRIAAMQNNLLLSGSIKHRLQQIVDNYLADGTIGLNSIKTAINNAVNDIATVDGVVDNIDTNTKADAESSTGNIFARIKWLVTQITSVVSNIGTLVTNVSTVISTLITNKDTWFVSLIGLIVDGLTGRNPSASQVDKVLNFIYDKFIKPTVARDFSNLEKIPFFKKVEPPP